MKNNKIISFPHLGNYHVPISYLLKKLTNLKVVKAPLITKKTIELGSKYSPDFVCLPFKYNLGNFIESLNNIENGSIVFIDDKLSLENFKLFENKIYNSDLNFVYLSKIIKE